MIYIVNPPSGTVHPALVVAPNLAFPIYDEPWGACISITNPAKAGLHRPSHIVISQPWRSFRKRRHLGDLDIEDRMRVRRIVNHYNPSLRSEMETL